MCTEERKAELEVHSSEESQEREGREGEMRNYNPGGTEMLARRHVKKIQSRRILEVNLKGLKSWVCR